MTVKNFDITFIFNRKNYEASCSEFQVVKVPQIYVNVKDFDKFGLAFTFYRTDPDELYWYDLNDEFKDGLAMAIANRLLEVL